MVRGRVLGTCTLSLQQGADGEGACPGHVYVRPAAGG